MSYNKKLYLINILVVAVIATSLYLASSNNGLWKEFVISLTHVSLVSLAVVLVLRKKN